MPKSSKRFILSNENLNSHGFVVKTDGIDLTAFKNNPVMYWMHVYPADDETRKALPIGYWDEIQVNGKELSAVPVFDDNDAFAMTIYNKVEHGTLRAASVALTEPVVLGTDKSTWVPGQTKPTVSKSKLGEASIVDRPSNDQAVTLGLSGKPPMYLQLSKNALNDLKNSKMETTTTTENPDKKSGKDYEPTPEMADIIKNTVDVGKYPQDMIDRLLAVASNDPEVIETVKGLIRKQAIKPENVKLKYHHGLISQAANNSYDDIKNGWWPE